MFGPKFALRVQSFAKRDSIFDVFVEVLQSVIFAEDSWATASDFQQQFGHMTCSISNKSTQSELTVCLGPPQRAVRKQLSVFVSKIFIIIKVEGNVFLAEVDATNKKSVFSRRSHAKVFSQKKRSEIFAKTRRKTSVQESFFSLQA